MNAITIALGTVFFACVFTNLALHGYTRLTATRGPQSAHTEARLRVVHHHLNNLGACSASAGATTLFIDWAMNGGPLVLAIFTAAFLGAVTLAAIVGYICRPQPEKASTT